MMQELRVAPPNSLLCIMDWSAAEIPESFNGSLVASTPTCIGVGTFVECDGETLVTLTDEDSPPSDADILVFDGALNVSSRVVSVCNVYNEVLMSHDILGTSARILVWTNHRSWPDRIHIAVLDK